MRYFHNTSWMFAEQMLRMIAGLFVGIWVARYLGPEQFGIFSYALAFTSIFSGIAKLGLDSIVVRDLVNEPEKRDVYLGTAFWLKLAGAFLTLGIVALATLFTSNDATTNWYIFIIASGMIFQSFEVIDFYFQSKVLSKFVSLCKITQLIFSSILKLYFILTASDLFWFVIVTVFDQATLAITLYIVYKYQKIGVFYCYFNIAIAKKLLNQGYPLMLAFLSYIIYVRIDQVMIQEMLDTKSVGLYSAAYRIYEVPLVIALTVASSTFPLMTRYFQTNREEFFRLYMKMSSIMTLVSYILVVFFYYTSSFIIKVTFGAEYRESAEFLSILSFGLIPMFNAFLRSSFITISGNQKIILFTTFFSAITNITLNIFLIKSLGVKGVIYATIITQVSSLLLLNIFFKETRKIFFLQLKSLLVIYGGIHVSTI